MLSHNTHINLSISINAVGSKIRHILTLPADLLLVQDQAIFENVGFKFEDLVCGKQVSLPIEWSFDSILHNDCFHIVDEKGRIRVLVAYLDKNQICLFMQKRFSLLEKHIDSGDIGYFVIDYDGTEIYYAVSCRDRKCHMFSRLERKANNYLSEHFPDWRSPDKYWDMLPD